MSRSLLDQNTDDIVLLEDALVAPSSPLPSTVSTLEQEDLYKRFIKPNTDELLLLFTFIRAQVDEIMFGVQEDIWMNDTSVTRADLLNRDISPLFSYPDRCCLSIVRTTLSLLKEMLETQAPYLKDFIQQGWTVRKKWGYYQARNGKNFLQNFLQIGDHIWDVAFEEMEPWEKRTVAVTPISKNKYREFHSLPEVIRVAEEYSPQLSYLSSVSLLGSVGIFYSNFCFHMSTGYLIHGFGNHIFSFENVVSYLKEAPCVEITSEIRQRFIGSIEDLLAFERDSFEEVELYFLEEIRLHLEKPPEKWICLEKRVWAIKNFVLQQANHLDISFEEAFSELSEIGAQLVHKIFDEYCDRLYQERKREKNMLSLGKIL